MSAKSIIKQKTCFAAIDSIITKENSFHLKTKKNPSLPLNFVMNLTTALEF